MIWEWALTGNVVKLGGGPLSQGVGLECYKLTYPPKVHFRPDCKLRAGMLQDITDLDRPGINFCFVQEYYSTVMALKPEGRISVVKVVLPLANRKDISILSSMRGIEIEPTCSLLAPKCR